MTTNRVDKITSKENNNRSVNQKRIEQILVKPGETLSSISSKFGMSPQEFMKWAGLKKTQVNIGQKINLPTSNVPDGKGIYFLARKYNMTMDEFAKMNKIPKPYNTYKVSKGEKFYVKNNKVSTAKPNVAQPKTVKKVTETPLVTSNHKVVANAPQKKVSSPKTLPHNGALQNKGTNPVTNNVKKWGSAYTPAELAKGIYKNASDHWGAVGRPDFDALIKEINSKNASAVIREYMKNPDNKSKESLINTITSEVASSADKRKAAVMHIYDALAKEKRANPSSREKFQNELNKEFDSWGMVSTKNLDKMLNNISLIEKPLKIAGRLVPVVHAEQISVSSKGTRPKTPRDDKGNVVAEIIKFLPSKQGPLSGKTITVNAGHGWGSGDKFAPGTSAQDSNGRKIYEWYKNRNFADHLIKQLTSQGATVIYTAGDAKQVCDAKRQIKSDLLISLHCNSASKDKDQHGLEIYYPVGSTEGFKFANVVDNHLDKLVSFGVKDGPNDRCTVKPDSATQYKSIGILQVNKGTVPSVLVEMGYQSNSEDLKNIDSNKFREDSMNRLTESVISYLRNKK